MLKIIERDLLVSSMRLRFMRNLLNIPQDSESLLSMCALSIGQIKAIENGTAKSIIHIHSYGYFMGLNPQKLYQQQFTFPEEKLIRSHLKQTYVDNKIDLQKDFLDTEPTLSTLILHRLIPEGFLDTPREVGNLIKIADYEYGIKVNSSSLSNQLKKFTDTNDVIINEKAGERSKYYKNPKLSDIKYLRGRQIWELLGSNKNPLTQDDYLECFGFQAIKKV